MSSLTRAAAVAHAVAGAAVHELGVFLAAPSALQFLVVGKRGGHGNVIGERTRDEERLRVLRF